MKVAAAFLLFVLTFVATILLMLYFTGNLDQESIARLLRRGEMPLLEPAPRAHDADPLMAALREKERALAERERHIAEEERRLALMRQELSTLRDNVERILREVDESLDEADEAYGERIQRVAESIASMEAQNAAETLMSELFTPQEAAEILQRIEEDRTRGNILNEMTPERAALILQALRNRRHGS